MASKRKRSHTRRAGTRRPVYSSSAPPGVPSDVATAIETAAFRIGEAERTAIFLSVMAAGRGITDDDVDRIEEWAAGRLVDCAAIDLMLAGKAAVYVHPDGEVELLALTEKMRAWRDTAEKAMRMHDDGHSNEDIKRTLDLDK